MKSIDKLIDDNPFVLLDDDDQTREQAKTEKTIEASVPTKANLLAPSVNRKTKRTRSSGIVNLSAD